MIINWTLGKLVPHEVHPILSTSDWKQWREQDCWLYRKPCEVASKNSNYIRIIPAWGLDKHRVKWICKASYSDFNHRLASVSKQRDEKNSYTVEPLAGIFLIPSLKHCVIKTIPKLIHREIRRTDLPGTE